MDRRIDGILSGYNRILDKIEILDPEGKNPTLNILKESMYIGIYGYNEMITDIQNYSDEAQRAINKYKNK